VKTWRLLFSAPMARAYVEGRKRVTRRFDRRLLKAQQGDLLLGKETWRTTAGLNGLSPAAIGEKCVDAGYSKPWAPIEYAADGARRDWLYGFEGEGEPKPGKTRVSIHLPDWASRIRARIVSVREEHLQRISAEDAVAEGIDPRPHLCGCEVCAHASAYCPATASSLVLAFAELWDSIHGTEPGKSWEDNPAVVRVEFAPEASS